MSQDPDGWIDRLVAWCFSILIGTAALYCAVRLLESVLPALIVAGGIVALLAALAGCIVVFRTWRNRW